MNFWRPTTVFLAKTEFVKVDDLSLSIHKPGLVMPQSIVFG